MEVNDFNKCVYIDTNKHKIKIECRLGLWGVEGRIHEQVRKEAFNYWQQYKDDGEYSSIIGGESVMDKLKQ